MAENLSDDDVRDLVMALWSFTVDARGQRLQAQTPHGQRALDMLASIIGAALVVDLKLGVVVDLDDHRPVSPSPEPLP